MTDKKTDEIDLSKEIENLDEFLDEHLDSIPLDGDDDTFIEEIFEDEEYNAIFDQEEKSKSSVVKLFAYGVCLTALVGGGYVAYKMAPQFLEDNNFGEFALMQSNDKVDSNSDVVEKNVADMSAILDQGMAEVAVEQLPEAIDNAVVEEDVTAVADVEINLVDNADELSFEIVENNIDLTEPQPFDDVPQIDAVERIDDLPAIDVEKIEDAKEIANMPADDLIEMVEEDAVGAAVIEETPSVQNVDTVEVADIPEVSENSVKAIEVSNTEVIESEEIAEQDMPVVQETVEEVMPVAEEISQPENVADNAETQMPRPPVEETIVEDIKTVEVAPVEVEEEIVPNNNVVEEIVAVEEKVVKPISQPKSKPKNIKKPKALDPRVSQAKSFLDKGEYAKALSLYQAILASDPSNTSALTGAQLARAKIRMNERNVVVAPEQVKATPPAQTVMPAPKENAVIVDTIKNNSAINSLLSQAQANPNDAHLALKIADAYAAQGDKVNALTWYRSALKIDVIHSSGIDRMAVYDAMVDVQN